MLFSADNSIDNNGNAVDEYNIRIAQGKAALNIPNVTVCTMLSLEDTLLPNGGLNIHPTDKAPIAEALVKAAIACRYIPAGDYSGAAEEYSGSLRCVTAAATGYRPRQCPIKIPLPLPPQ